MTPNDLSEALAERTHITVLTGAGISAPSGISTFRPNGEVATVDGHSVEVLSSADTWKKRPQLTWNFYLQKMAEIRAATPNAAHVALAELGAKRTVPVFTQNLDDLHERAGSKSVAHFHGVTDRFVCTFCAEVYGPDDIDWETGAMKWCECGYRVRPDIVLFGEQLPAGPVTGIEALLETKRTEALLVVGTSLNVFPVASFPLLAMDQSIPVFEINPRPTEFSDMFTGFVRGTGERILPRVVEGILNYR